MKKFYLLAASAAIISTANAAKLSLEMLNDGWKNAIKSEQVLKLKQLPSWDLGNTRSAEEPQISFTATNAEFYYMGDLLGNGTGVYQLFLANMPINKGLPTAPGQIARLEIIGNTTDENNPELCTGTFTVMPITDEIPPAGSIIAEDSDILDVFIHPEDPSAGLVAYSFTPAEGTLTIDKEGDTYSISYDISANLINADTDEIILTQNSECTYTGECTYVDLYAYTPFEEDLEFSDLQASGRYTDGGDYSITFYTPGLLDEEGWIVAAGYTLNAELFVEDVAPMNLDDLVRTFTPNDVFAKGPVPGTFGQGIWYDMFGMYVAILTAVTEYDNSGNVARVALAKEGTITGSKIGDDYKIAFDLTSAEGHKITAEWIGDLKAAVTDFSTPSAVDKIGYNPQMITGGKGHINAPADALIYNLSGHRVASDNLPAGIYLVHHNGKSFKVAVR